MIAVLDYGVGNLSSVANMLRKAGGDAYITRDPAEVLRADKLLLPGVGHFDYGMKMLNGSGLRDAIDQFALQLKRPVLGICLGAQILGRGSEEGDTPGLGWIDMVCRRLQVMPGIRVPHMGWNQIVCRKPSPLLDRMGEDARFYFVHSYRMSCGQPEDVLATAVHGIEFVCMVQRANIIGTQFHPEKSLRHGLALMRSFVELPI
jgi:imidazole glycerol-phosphate synthase subunit HisH